MSDRRSQAIFSELFSFIGKNPPPDIKEIACKMWKLAEECDTHPGDWEVDDELIAFGLAKKGINPQYRKDGEVTLYKGIDYDRRRS